MATETLTAEQALDEVLAHLFDLGEGWRERLAAINQCGLPDSRHAATRSGSLTVGDLRRWSAPLREKE